MSRRRAYSSDEEEDLRSHKRSRHVSPNSTLQTRLHSLIKKVGEKSSSSLESNIEGLARVLNTDMANSKKTILRILYDCVIEMPSKLTVYSTLVGLLNLHHYNTGGDFVDMLVLGLRDEMRSGYHAPARIIVRFLADLVNCYVVSASSLLSFFDNFFDVTREDNVPQCKADFYVFCILSALPWVGAELAEKKEVEFNQLLHNIDVYIKNRQKIHVPALRVWSSNEPNPQEEYLDCMWSQICTLKHNGWTEKHILRPYRAFSGSLCDAMQHNLPLFIPPTTQMDYPLPSVVFRLFDYTDVPEDGPLLPGLHAIERFLIEEHLHLVVNTSFLDKKDCAAQLLEVPMKDKVPLNYMILEVLFSQLFNMPRPQHLELFYGSVMIELCKLQPSTMPQVLAQTTEMLYDRLDTMNTACIERFTSWFSYHLSNFMFRWGWADWEPDIAGDGELPKCKFIREVLNKCIRLSYHDRIIGDLPPEFSAVMPPKPRAMFKYEQEGVGQDPGTMVAHKLIAAVRSKSDNEEILDILDELPNPRKEGDDATVSNFNPLKVEVFTQTLLFLGAKSFSHTFAAISKFYDVFKVLTRTEEAQLCLLRAMKSIWRYNPQMMCVIIDKLLKTEIVQCSAVANWIFSPEMSADLTSFYIWEIMHGTIKKMNNHVTQLQRQLELAKDKLEDAEKRGDDIMERRDLLTHDQIERLEEKLDVVSSEQKNLFLIVFQRFIIILTDHLMQCEAKDIDYNTTWYKWIIERLQQVFLQHHEQVYHHTKTLEELIFTSDIDLHILEVFQQFCSLRS